MRFWVGVTDNGWFNFLAGSGLDEVNFWQPSGKPPFDFTTVPQGMPFLFKLKKPHNHIAGGGFFITYSRLPLALAWEVFGKKCGVETLEGLIERLGRLAGRTRVTMTTEIGCTVLTSPFFLPQDEWIPVGDAFLRQTVVGKFLDDEGSGAAIWQRVSAALSRDRYAQLDDRLVAQTSTEPRDKFGTPILTKPRLGQSSFRVMVTDAYKRRCAITGESTLLALEAAHIVPYAEEQGSHDVRNGLLLRADFHRLFDAGLVGVNQDLRIKVSPKIRETWFNGKAYYRLNDQPLTVVPDLAVNRPDPDRLKWHFENRFQA
jgi:putative restriction endonuclease